MNRASLVKAFLIQAAYQGASAVCGPLAEDDGKPLPIDPLIQDSGVRRKGVMVYEEAKVQYHAILRAFHDQSGVWPDPKVESEPGGLAGLISQAAGLLAQLPRDTPLNIGQLLDLLARTAGPAARQPGQELAAG